MVKKLTPLQKEASERLQAIFVKDQDSGELTPFTEAVFKKDDMLWDLQNTVNDVERQVDEKWRWKRAF
jgi:hypothetical protein